MLNGVDCVSLDMLLDTLYNTKAEDGLTTLPEPIWKMALQLARIYPGTAQAANDNVQPLGVEVSTEGIAKHVQDLINKTPDHANMYLWKLAFGMAGTTDIAPPPARLHVLGWRLNMSPAGGKAMPLISQAVRQGKRVLVMVMNS